MVTEFIPNIATVDEEEVERLNQQRAKLAEQRQRLEADIQSLSQAAKSDKPEQERLNKAEVCSAKARIQARCLPLAPSRMSLMRGRRSSKGK